MGPYIYILLSVVTGVVRSDWMIGAVAIGLK